MAKSLYVHIPFCHHLCAYCDFAKVLYSERWAFSYLSSLKRELESLAIEEKLETIYVGGGTPSSLSLELLSDLLLVLRPLLGEGYEFSVEMNPEDLKEDKLEILRRYGVNRLSVGIESSVPRLLALMDRNHTFLEAKEGIGLAKRMGFSRLSADLIYGLPGERKEEVREDIDNFLSLDIDHLSAYCLSVNEGTLFHNRGYHEMGEEEAGEQYEMILAGLREAGYRRYEVSNFARNGQESKHNLTYWHDDEYYAIGLGAASYVSGVRGENTRNLSKYLRGEWRAKEEKVTREDELKEFFLTNFRLEEGFEESRFEERFGFPFFSRYIDAYTKLSGNGLLTRENGHIRPTDRGMMILDTLLMEFF